MTSTERDEDLVPELLDPLVQRARQRIGQALREKWRLDALLGVSGMASVYAATHRNGSRVDVKMLHPELSINPQVRTRFLREGYVANSVGHDGAVRVMDDDTADDGSLFLVTELLDGETLEDRRVRFGGRLSEDEVLCITDQLLDVLVAAHARGVIHRDLKPENVFLTNAGVVKVLDFGIARLREMSSASTATRSGASMGTPSYMPPEQARGRWEEVDARSDLWAVGATMFTLLTGKLVHDGHTANEVLLEAMTKPAPPLTSVVPEVSPAVALVADKALAFEREHRWRDAGTMQEGVRSAYHDRHGSPISTAPRLTVPPTVVNRTLASATVGPVSPRARTTNGGVVASHLGASQYRAPVSLAARFSRPRPITLGVGSAVVVAAIGGAAALLSSGSKAPPSSATGATSIAPARAEPPAPRAVSSSQASPTAPAAREPNSAQVIAVTDLPVETAPSLGTTKAAPRPPLPGPAPATSTTTAKTAKPGCNPPYVLDPASGTKRWKAECF